MSRRLLLIVSACLASVFAPACTAPGGVPASVAGLPASPPPAEDDSCGLWWELTIGGKYSVFKVPYGEADRRTGRLRWVRLYSFADGFGGRMKIVPRGEANVGTFFRCDLHSGSSDCGLLTTRHGELLAYRVLTTGKPVPAGKELDEDLLADARLLRAYRKESPPPAIRIQPERRPPGDVVNLTVVRTLPGNAWSGKSWDGRYTITFVPSGNECTVEISDREVCRFKISAANPVFRSGWIDPFDTPVKPDNWGDGDGTPDFWKLLQGDKQIVLYHGHGILVRPNGTLLEVHANPKAVARLRERDNKAWSRYVRLHSKRWNG